MSLFPAYAPPGSSRGGRRQGQGQRRGNEARDGNSSQQPLFVIDKQGGGRHDGEPEIVTLDSVDSSDGELPSSGSPEEVKQSEKSSSSSAKKKRKNKKSHKRRRTRSRSRSPKKIKRRRSRSVEEVGDSSKDYRDDKGYQKNRDSKGGYGGGDGYGYDNSSGPSRGYNDRDRGGVYDRDDRGRGNRGWGRGGGGSRDNFGGGGGGRDNYRGGGGRDNYGGRDDYYNDRYGGNQQERGRDQRGGGVGGSGRHEYYEDQRVQTAQRFPKKVFLEEVNLKPEYAFRVDTERVQRNLQFHSLSNFQKSFYDHGGKVIGATDQELGQIYSKFSKFRCILPQGIDDDGNPIEDEANEDSPSAFGISKSSSSSEITFRIDKRGAGSRPTTAPCETFISIGNNSKDGGMDGYDERMNTRDGFEGLSIPRKDGELSLKQKIEKYNADLRQNPRNIALWKEFLEFQDQVFEEAGHIYNFEEDGNEQGRSNQQGSKKKRNRKALTEKKVAILDKALESNPRNLDLHILRLDLLYEIRKPGFVLTEWKKLVANNQQVAPFWVEYLRFASTQLQIYTSSSLTSLFEKCFQKFRQMINPSFPESQRPKKFALVIGDLLLALSLMLKNAGYRERAVALQQAQLEIDFFCPSELLEDETLVEWKEDRQLFDIFWDLGTPKFGEPGATGWTDVVVNKNIPEKSIVGIPDGQVSEFEDLFFETVNEEGNELLSTDVKKRKHWLTIESLRSKLYWLPWRASCSDSEDVEDAQRLVLAADVSPFAFPVPVLPYVTDFDRQSAYFRHTVNFLVSLQEDFIPQTQTLDSVLSAFSALSITESRSLFSEVFYWKKLLSLYVNNNSTVAEELSNFLKTPEGFRVMDLTSANPIVVGGSTEIKISLCQYPDKVEELKSKILRQNHTNQLTTIRSVVDKAIDCLEAPFSALIFEMYLRFEQKNTFATEENRKTRMKHAKTLMKKEKLRNSMTCFREMGMLELFEGNPTNAIDILVKTINLGCNTLTMDDSENFDLEKDWEKFAELTHLYRTLAELYISSNQPMAYNVLALLGCGFKPIKTDLTEDELTMKTNVMLKALRQFEKIFAQLLPGVELEEVTEESPILEQALSKWDGDKSVEFLVQKSNLIVEWTRTYAMFQCLAKDFDAASEVFEKALSIIKVSEPLGRSNNYNENLVNRHNMREQLFISWCNLGAFTLSKNSLINAKFRSILGRALKEFPSSPPLLLLFTDVENQMSIAGKLWRMMVLVVKQDGGCNHWAPLFMGMGLAKKIEDLEHDEEIGLDSFGLGGPAVPPDTIFYKLDAMLTAGQQNSRTRNCPLIWRVHLKLLALRAQVGKDVKRAVATFYDAVRHCPSAKALYLDGVTYFPEMFQEIVDLMAEKQLYVRLPAEELDVLLEIENEAKGKNKNDGGSSPDCEIVSDGEV